MRSAFDALRIMARVLSLFHSVNQSGMVCLPMKSVLFPVFVCVCACVCVKVQGSKTLAHYMHCYLIQLNPLTASLLRARPPFERDSQ